MKKNVKLKISLIIFSAVFIMVLNPLMNDSFVRGNKEGLNSTNNFNLDIDLSMQTGIFGYKLDLLNNNPIERDENAVITIDHVKRNSAEVIITTIIGEFNFSDLPVEEETIDTNIKRTMCRYELENPRIGFFMEIHIMSDLTRINIAFDGGNTQLNYDGVIEKGLKNYKTITGDSLKPTDLELSNRKINRQEYIEKLKIQQNRNIQVNKREMSAPLLESRENPWYIYKYGVVHEGYDFELDYPDDLWDDYWDPYTSLDYGVYRYLPTETQVKSDLQYYNTVIAAPYSGSKRIIPYTMVTHGGPEWGIYEWQDVWVWDWWPFFGHWETQQVHIGTIYPSEISNLWYTNGNTYVYPAESLVMVDVCYGYWKTVNNPDMAEAFVDDGGTDAFVGATILVPAASDDFMYVFWDELSRLNEDVYDATDALCDEYGSPWNVGDEWRIMGDTSKELPD